MILRRSFEVAERLDDDDYEVQESRPIGGRRAGRQVASSLRCPDFRASRRSSTESESGPVDFEAEQRVHTFSRRAATHESSLPFPGYAAAPSTAPKGRTLEHETLEDDEMEFHPVPENLEALSEVAGDRELDAGRRDPRRRRTATSERWVPKIADVDEEEVIAAEERGEKIYQAPRSDEEDGDEGGRGRDQWARRVACCVADRGLSAAASRAPAAMIAAISVAAAAVAAATTFVLGRTPTAAAADHRSAERRAGGPGPDCQGAHQQEGRPHYQPHRACRAVSWCTCRR